jgi:hypothetical protein
MNITKIRVIVVENDSNKFEDMVQEYVDNISASSRFRVGDIKYQLQIDGSDALYSAMILTEDLMD